MTLTERIRKAEAMGFCHDRNRKTRDDADKERAGVLLLRARTYNAVEPQGRNPEAMSCMCTFEGCSGTGVAHCSPPCGGDQCICACGGEATCYGCDACDGDGHDLGYEPTDLDGGDT